MRIPSWARSAPPPNSSPHESPERTKRARQPWLPGPMFVAITSDDGWCVPPLLERSAAMVHGLESPFLQWLSMPGGERDAGLRNNEQLRLIGLEKRCVHNPLLTRMEQSSKARAVLGLKPESVPTRVSEWLSMFPSAAPRAVHERGVDRFPRQRRVVRLAIHLIGPTFCDDRPSSVAHS